MRMKSLILIFIALGCGLVASIGISQVMNRDPGPTLEMEQVLVALTDVDIGTKLDAQSVWTNPNDVWIGNVVRTARAIAGVGGEIGAAPYFTDASILTPALGGPPTAIIGPGELELAHQTDEYCLVSRIEQATEIYAAIIRDWCAL